MESFDTEISLGIGLKQIIVTLRHVFVRIQCMVFIRDVHLMVHVVSSSAIAILGTLSLVQRFDVCSLPNHMNTKM